MFFVRVHIGRPRHKMHQLPPTNSSVLRDAIDKTIDMRGMPHIQETCPSIAALRSRDHTTKNNVQQCEQNTFVQTKNLKECRLSDNTMSFDKCFEPLHRKNDCSPHCHDTMDSKNHNIITMYWSYFSECFKLLNVITAKSTFKLGQRGDAHWKNHAWRTFCVLFISLMLATVCSADSNECAPGLKTHGKTWPQGDIVLEYGKSLQILCILNKTSIDAVYPGKNASDLVFFRNKKRMEAEYIKTVNETTISLDVTKPPPAEDMYYCKLRLQDYFKPDEAVCLNKVVIGFKPQAPENFTCISHNWENLTCTWVPVQNYVTTRFSLAFKLPGITGRKVHPCPQNQTSANMCFWDATTDPIYRQAYEYYTFQMNVKNVLGNISIQHKIHHYANVIPAKPTNLSVVNKTSDSALLHWNVSYPMQNFPPGLHHRVTYQNQWDHKKTWKVINITNDVKTSNRYFNLTNLEYANTGYDVRVFMKSAVAVGEDKWSQFSDVTFRTPPRLPGMPPRTDIGSFEIAENNANRDVYLYWQAIPRYLENGDNFTYHINYVEENGRKISLLPNETTRAYAKFKGISFNSYRFEIVTINIVGTNKEKASIFVSSRQEMPHEPIAFTKIAFDGGLYELSWKPPIGTNDIVNYTIFWCDNERDRPYQCTGYLDWVHVSKTTTIYNMTVPDPKKVYQFAISANTKVASSGMVWASCTVIHNKVVGKMKSVWINRIGSDFIEVGWKLDCSDRIGIVEGFNIYYCPILSPYDFNCKGPKLNTTIRADPHTIHGIVNGLKPYTTYMVSVAVLTKSGESLHSDPLYNTTLEAAPITPPKDVKITNVTNTTMLVTWNPPDAMNGVLRYYEVYYNELSQKVERVNYVELTGLLAHTNYSISVAACTVSCSVKSPTIYKSTGIGVPGKINVPHVRFMNSSQVFVIWKAPQNSAGYLNYYEISSNDGKIQNSTRSEAQLPIPDCKTVGREKLYQFRVRAVNIASNNDHLKGPWSDPGEGNCYSDGPSFRVWVIIWVIGSLSGVAFLFCLAYTSKRMWLKCKAMQDVEVKLPPGLAPNMKLLQKVGEQHVRQSSADSSGCSSGQESVTSSLTSDSQVSNDSGTEIDPAPNKLLETAPAWEASNLRQRNVGASRPGLAAEATRWDAYVKVAKSGEPIMGDSLSLARSAPNLTDSTGYTTSQQTWSSTGYISMPSSEELSGDPSPVPKESTAGNYSIVGTVHKSPLRTKSIDEVKSKSAEESLIPIKKVANATNPYITLAAFEQKNKEKSAISSLRDLDNLSFIETNKTKADNLKNLAAFDKNSKPYVQTGIIDPTKKPFSLGPECKMTIPSSFAPTSLTDTCKKPFVSAFVTSATLQPTSKDSTKPYIAVSAIPELTKTNVPALKQLEHKSYNAPVTEAMSKPYVLTTSVFQMLQDQNPINEGSVSDLEDSEASEDSQATYPLNWSGSSTKTNIKVDVDKTLPINKQSSGYVTIPDKPLGQHDRCDKSLTQCTSAPSDEQYSKVTVVPSTLQ
ncbi:uncharacterized protein [Prorops nasuta]|uniref:uncharacterized protein n=1 Tax=Prorops nasuta TaxID=863751 RepID=UPI0034CE5F49